MIKICDWLTPVLAKITVKHGCYDQKFLGKMKQYGTISWSIHDSNIFYIMLRNELIETKAEFEDYLTYAGGLHENVSL